MGQIEQIFVMIGGNTAGLTAALAGAGKQVEGFGAKATVMGGKLTKGLTLPIVAIGAASVYAFANFDEAMTNSLAIMGDVSEEMRGAMSDAAREVAKTTTYSATQAAEAYYYLASAGMDAATAIEAMPRVAKFAQAGNFDLALATDILTDAQSALGMVTKDVATDIANMTRISDVLVKATSLANATTEQFGEGLINKLAPSLRSVGKSVEEGVAGLAVLADQGLKGSEAGEALSRVMVELRDKAVTNTSAFKKYNIAVFDANGNMRHMTDILTDVERAFEGVSDEQATTMEQELGLQKRSADTMRQLFGTSEAWRNYEAALKSAGGATDDVANKQMESFKAKLSVLKSKFIDVGISIGEKLVPAIEKMMPTFEKIGGAIAKVVEIFSNLPGPVQTAIIALIGIAAVAGPVMSTFSTISHGVHGLIKVFGSAATAASGFISRLAETYVMGGSISQMSVGTAAGIGAIGAAAVVAGIALKKMADDVKAAYEEATRAQEEFYNTQGKNQVDSAKEATAAYVLLKDSLDHTSEGYNNLKSRIMAAGVSEGQATMAAALAMGNRKEALHALNVERQRTLGLLRTEQEAHGANSAAAQEYERQLAQLNALHAEVGASITHTTEEIRTAVNTAIESMAGVPIEVQNQLRSTIPEQRQIAIDGMTAYIEGISIKKGIPPAQAAEIAAEVRTALSSENPQVQADALANIDNILRVLVDGKQLSAVEAAAIAESIRSNLEVGEGPVSKLRNTLENMQAAMESKKGGLAKVAAAIGALVQAGLTAKGSPDISYKVPKVYKRMFANIEGEFSVNVPSLVAQVDAIGGDIPNGSFALEGGGGWALNNCPITVIADNPQEFSARLAQQASLRGAVS